MELIQRRVTTHCKCGAFTPVRNKVRKVPLDDILCIEVEGNTVRYG